MLHHMGLPARYSVAVPPSAAAASRLPLTAPTALPSFSASAMPLQMYLHGIAQRENMLRNAFADYLKPVCTPDGEILLDVECGENRGLLYLSRFCQGSKGPCIRFDDMWLTPNEFQYISGRESAKDWKRSIRHQGKSLKLLLAKGILTVHQSSCSCTGCRISSPVNRGKLANCNPRLGYETMFDFSDKPLPHLFGSFPATTEPDGADNPLSPSNPSHSSKGSSESSSGESRNYRSSNDAPRSFRGSISAGDEFYDRKMASSSIHLPARTTLPSGLHSKDFNHQFLHQPVGDLGPRDTYPVYRPIAQMFSGMSASQNVEMMQSILSGSSLPGHPMTAATHPSAFYPFGLATNQPGKDSPVRSSSSEISSSPSPVTLSDHSPSSDEDSKSPEPLDLTTSRSGKAPKQSRHIKPNNPPPGGESQGLYGNRFHDKKPYSRPTTSLTSKTANCVTSKGCSRQSATTTQLLPAGPLPPNRRDSNENDDRCFPIWLGHTVEKKALDMEDPVRSDTELESDSEGMDCERSQSV